MLSQLPIELINMIVDYLDIADAYNMLSSCSILWKYRTEIIYRAPVWYFDIMNLSHSDKFVQVKYDNMSLDPVAFPKLGCRIKHLYYHHYTNLYLHYWNHITHLDMANYFDDEIKGVLPPGLKYLNLGHTFDRPIGHQGVKYIPDSVQKLIFGFSFNQPIQGLLPQSLLYLEFGYNFNQDIGDNQGSYLPDGIEYVDLGIEFNKTLYLPCGLKYLTLSYVFNQDIKGQLPNGLIYLDTKYTFNQPVGELYQSFLPAGLQTLKLGYHFNQCLEYNNYSYIPAGVKVLHIGKYFDQLLNIEHLHQLTELKIGSKFDRYFIIPASVQTLALGSKFKPNSPDTA